MGVHRRKMAVVGFSVLAGVLGLATVAWACTYQPSLFAPSAQAGHRGTEVTVRGEGAPRGPVEIRWNAVDGPRLATAAVDISGGFSASISIPDATPDVYYLVAVADSAAIARSAFEVTADASSRPAQAPTIAAAESAFWPAPGDASTTPASSSGTDAGFVAGMALLAVGMVALSIGFGTVVIRARRVRSGGGVD